MIIEFKNSIINKFRMEINIQHIFGILCNSHDQLALEQLNKTVQDF